MHLLSITDIRRLLGDDRLALLDTLAYSGAFDSDVLDTVAVGLSGKGADKGLFYYLASLYLQLGESDKASDLLRSAGRPSREMKWFPMVLLHSRFTGLRRPGLENREERCLEYLQQFYSGSVRSSESVAHDRVCALEYLFKAPKDFAVIGNAPSSASDDVIRLSADCTSVCFNSYALNPRIAGEALIHVVTPSYTIGKLSTEQHLVITGNAVFYRRSRVWRRFLDCPPCAGIHTLPRQHWSALVGELNASPSAGLLLLSYLDRYCDLAGKNGLIAGFSSSVPIQNHSYDQEPVSDRHNWSAEILKRQRVVQSIQRKARSLRIV